MLKVISTLSFVFMSVLVSEAAQAESYVSIATCKDAEFADSSPLKILVGMTDETQGLLVSTLPSPDVEGAEMTAAETITVQKINEGSYSVTLGKESFLGAVAGSYNFQITNEGVTWKLDNRTYLCKLDQ